VFRQVSIDDTGVVSYIKGDGVYAFGRFGGVKRLVAVGDDVPRAGGQFAEFLDVANTTVALGPFISELRIAFKARITGGTVSEGIFVFSEDSGLDVVALPGDIAPNTAAGSFASFPGKLLINQRGTILFQAMVTGGKATNGLFASFRQLLTGTQTLDSVAVQGDVAPDSGAGAFSSFGDYTLTQGDIVLPFFPFLITVDVFGFIANIESGRVPQGVYLSRFFLAQVLPAPLFEIRAESVLNTNTPVPGERGAMQYTRFKALAVTPTEVAYLVDLTETATNRVFEGIYQTVLLGPIPVTNPRVLQGQRAPVPGGRYNFVSFERMVANTAEELVFVATLDGGGPSEGLFSVSLGPLQLLSTTFVAGQEVGGSDGCTYADFGPLAINTDGYVAFLAKLSGCGKTEAVFRELAKRARMIDSVP
jgi:hypothetical protein